MARREDLNRQATVVGMVGGGWSQWDPLTPMPRSKTRRGRSIPSGIKGEDGGVAKWFLWALSGLSRGGTGTAGKRGEEKLTADTQVNRM